MKIIKDIIAAAPPGSDNKLNYLLIVFSFIITGTFAGLLINNSQKNNLFSKQAEESVSKGIVSSFLSAPISVVFANFPNLPSWMFIESAPRLPSWILLVAFQFSGAIVMIFYGE